MSSAPSVCVTTAPPTPSATDRPSTSTAFVPLSPNHTTNQPTMPVLTGVRRESAMRESRFRIVDDEGAAEEEDSGEWFPLHKAVYTNNLRRMRQLIDEGGLKLGGSENLEINCGKI